MRKYLLFAFLFVSYIAMAQLRFPLVKDGGIWRIFGGAYDASDPYSTATYYRLQFDMLGDTLINGRMYKKLYYVNAYDSLYRNLHYYGALREDSLGRVYVLSHDIATQFNINDSVELLLYDFNVSTGDIIRIPNAWAADTINNIVIKIDSTVVSGQWRKRFYTVGYGFSQRIWIEGIGDQKGLFFPFYGEFENFSMLSCYEDSNTYWENPMLTAFGGDCYKVGIEEPDEKVKKRLQLYPNPATDFINFVFIKAIGQESTLVIYNFMGQQIASYSILKYQNRLTINIMKFAKGIFYYRLFSDNRLLESGSFIKK